MDSGATHKKSRKYTVMPDHGDLLQVDGSAAPLPAAVVNSAPKCYTCRIGFGAEKALWSHIKSEYDASLDKNYLVNCVCELGFETFFALNRHIAQHSECERVLAAKFGI